MKSHAHRIQPCFERTGVDVQRSFEVRLAAPRVCFNTNKATPRLLNACALFGALASARPKALSALPGSPEVRYSLPSSEATSGESGFIAFARSSSRTLVRFNWRASCT